MIVCQLHDGNHGCTPFLMMVIIDVLCMRVVMMGFIGSRLVIIKQNPEP